MNKWEDCSSIMNAGDFLPARLRNLRDLHLSTKLLNMRKVLSHTLFMFTVTMLMATALEARNQNAAVRVDDVIWANGEIYSTVLTQNSFKMPPAHSVDILFNFEESGLSGQRPVSDAAPGDRHYNGGRWAVYLVKFTESGKAAHDADGDGAVDFELDSAAMVYHHAEVLGHLEIMPADVYFSCPLVK